MLPTDSIEPLYTAFSKYKLHQPVQYCQCGCIPIDESEKIYAAPLKKLSSEQLSLYSYKAISTWGELGDFKHFLPRLIELYLLNPEGQITLETIVAKLKYADWKSWAEEEKSAIQKCILEDWNNLVNDMDRSICPVDLQEYLEFLSLESLMAHWHYKTDPVSLINLVNFIYEYGIEFYTQNQADESISFKQYLINNDFESIAEDAFFKVHSTNPVMANKISEVLELF